MVNRLQENRGSLVMSTVNLTECLILVEDKQPALFPQIRRKILESGIRFVPVSVTHAELASEARMKFPLNLGDCFAYALAQASGDLLLAVDEDFQQM